MRDVREVLAIIEHTLPEQRPRLELARIVFEYLETLGTAYDL